MAPSTDQLWPDSPGSAATIAAARGTSQLRGADDMISNREFCLCLHRFLSILDAGRPLCMVDQLYFFHLLLFLGGSLMKIFQWNFSNLPEFASTYRRLKRTVSDINFYQNFLH